MPLNPRRKRLNFHNKIYHGSATNMQDIPDQSVHLIFTSPPYFEARKEYQKENQTLEQYLNIIFGMIRESVRVLVNGGRLIINIANVGRSPYIPLSMHIHLMADNLHLIRRGEIIWDKGASAGNSTAWGSWRSASNPTLRDVHEYLLVFSKGNMKRSEPNRINTISASDFPISTQSVWHISSMSAKKRKHPAPFPLELARRIIELYSFKNDIVLDPFMGSGTTAEAAILLHRHYVGYELVKEYIDLANSYIDKAKQQRGKRGET